MVYKISKDGRITVPKEIREQFDTELFDVELIDNKIIFRPIEVSELKKD